MNRPVIRSFRSRARANELGQRVAVVIAFTEEDAIRAHEARIFDEHAVQADNLIGRQPAIRCATR